MPQRQRVEIIYKLHRDDRTHHHPSTDNSNSAHMSVIPRSVCRKTIPFRSDAVALRYSELQLLLAIASCKARYSEELAIASCNARYSEHPHCGPSFYTSSRYSDTESRYSETSLCRLT